MDLKTKLNTEKNNKIEAFALNFAEELEPKLVKSAQDGYSGFQIPFEGREDTHLLKDKLFLECLNELIDGCTAKIKTTEYMNILNRKCYKHHLVISW